MSQDTVKLNLAAALEGGTKAAFKAVADGFRSLGKEVKLTSKALYDAGKTEAADTMGHLGMAIDRTSKSFKDAAKTGKMAKKAFESSTASAKDYADSLTVVGKAYKHYSDGYKATGSQLKEARARTNALDKAIQQFGFTLKDGNASEKNILKWKESLDLSKVLSGSKKEFKITASGFKNITEEGLKLLGVENKLAKAAYEAGAAREYYGNQLRKGIKVGARYTNAVKELGKEHTKANSEVKKWGPALQKAAAGMEDLRKKTNTSVKNTVHWTKTTKLAAVANGILDGNIKSTADGLRIMNDKGLIPFTKLTVNTADSLKMLSRGFDNLSVKTGAKSLTEYGKAVEAARGQSDKFSRGLTDLSKKYGVNSARFRVHYEDMKKSDSIWRKHVTTLEKTGKITKEMGEKLSNSFNASKVSSVALATALSKPNKQFAELDKTINRVSVATGKSTESLWEQTKALQAQRTPHNKIVNSLNASIGANREYASTLTSVRSNEKVLAKLRGESVTALRKKTDAILDHNSTAGKEVKIVKLLNENIKDRIVKQKELNASSKRLLTSTVRLTDKYHDQIGKYRGLEKSIGNVAKAYGRSSDEGKIAEGVLKRHIKWYEKNAQSAGLFSRALQDVGKHIKSFASYATAASFIAGIVGAFQQATVAVIEFDQALKDLQAITGATDREVELMGETIKQVASTTKFSATEVAAGMKTLGQAGLSAKEAIQTIQAVSDLATGTLSDMGTAVDLVTTAMRVFDIEATESGRIADVFANAINRSKLTVDKLRIAFNYVGPIAARAGVDFEEVASSMMVLANSGVRASTIGTGLRQVFAKLVKPTDAFKLAVTQAGFTMEDFDLKSKSMREVIENLSIVVTDAGDAFKFFGLRGATAISALTQANVQGFSAMMEAVTKTGTAAAMASKQMEGLGVKIKNMWDKAKNLAIALGEMGLAGVLHVVVDTMRSLITVLTELAGNPITGFIVKIGAASVVVTGLVMVVQALSTTSLITWFVGSATAASGFSVALSGASASITLFLSKIPVIGLVLIGVSAALFLGSKAYEQWANSSQKAYDKSKNLAEEFEVLGNKIDSYKVKIAGVDTASKEFTTANLVLRGELSKVSKRFDEVGTLARKAEASIHALDGTFYDGGKAVKEYRDKLHELEVKALTKSAESAEAAFAKALTSATSYFSMVFDRIKTLAKLLKTVSFDSFLSGVLSAFGKISGNDTLSNFLVQMERSEAAFEKLNIASKKFKNGAIGYKEYKAVLMDQEVAVTELGKTMIQQLLLIEESVTTTINSLMDMGEIDLTMTSDEVLAVKAALDKTFDATSNTAKIMKYFFDIRKQGAAESSTGLADRWSKELDGTAKGFNDFYSEIMAGDDKVAKSFITNNEKVLRAYEDRKKAVAEALIESRKEFSGPEKGREREQAEFKYNEKAKKLRGEARKDEILNRGLRLRDLKRAEAKEMAQIKEKYGNSEKLSNRFHKESLKAERKYAELSAEIMGTRLNPEKTLKGYAAFKEAEETLLKNSLLEIERQRALDLISQEEYETKKIELTHHTYRAIAFEADWLYNKLKDQGADPADTQKMFKLMSDAVQKYKSEQISTFRDIQKAGESNAEKMKDTLEKQSDEYEKHTDKIVKLETDASKKIVNEKLKLNEKIRDLLEDRAEIEKDAIMDTEDMHSSISDDIRDVYQRGMTDEQKNYDNRTRAQEKYAQGITALNKAIRTGDEDHLDRAKGLLEDSRGFYKNLESTGQAVSGLRKIEQALSKTIDAGKRIEITAVDREISNEQRKHDVKVRSIQILLRTALQAETKRHNKETTNLNTEIALLKEKGIIIQKNLDIALGKQVRVTEPIENKAGDPVSSVNGIPVSNAEGTSDIVKIGNEWTNVKSKIDGYNQSLAGAERITASHAKKVKEAEVNFQNMERSAGDLSDNVDNVKQTLDELEKKSGSSDLTTNDIDAIIVYYSAQLDKFKLEQSKNAVSIISEEKSNESLGNIQTTYLGMISDLFKNPLPVVFEIVQDTLNAVNKAIQKLQETVIKIPVEFDKPGSIEAYSGGQVGKMYGGGRIGGLFGFSSSRDTELIKARRGEWFVKNESGDYWGQEVMKGITEPFSSMGRTISSVLSTSASMSRNNVTANKGNLQSSGGDDIFNAMQSFGTVNLNLPTSGPAIPMMMRQNDIASFLSQIKTMGKLSS